VGGISPFAKGGEAWLDNNVLKCGDNRPPVSEIYSRFAALIFFGRSALCAARKPTG
jgi:hypothetical protein